MLLSHSQIYSTIAAGVLNLRVREGNGCFYSAMSTGKKYYNKENVIEKDLKENHLIDRGLTHKLLTIERAA